jgi:hypothetical protein
MIFTVDPSRGEAGRRRPPRLVSSAACSSATARTASPRAIEEYPIYWVA